MSPVESANGFISRTVVDDSFPVGSVQIRALDDVVFRIGPVEPRCRIVHREAVRPEERRVGDGQAILAVHRRPLDLRLLAPVRPEYRPEG